MILLRIQENFVSMKFIIIAQFQITSTTNYRALKHFMNLHYFGGHERARNLLFHYIVFIL
jgi:hypothetical protein